MFSLVFQLKDVENDLGKPGFGDALLYGSSTRLDFGSRDRLALEDLDPLSSEHGSLKRRKTTDFLKFRLLD